MNSEEKALYQVKVEWFNMVKDDHASYMGSEPLVYMLEHQWYPSIVIGYFKSEVNARQYLKTKLRNMSDLFTIRPVELRKTSLDALESLMLNKPLRLFYL
jgi:hypothetical protein